MDIAFRLPIYSSERNRIIGNDCLLVPPYMTDRKLLINKCIFLIDL
jgi:hypothetical protein